MTTSVPDITCPCGSQKTYQQCCGRLHNGSIPAKTARDLMRARYSAFVVKDENYLQQSWHPSTRPAKVLDSNADYTEWKGLNILDHQAGEEGDSEGEVEFIARFIVHKQPGQLHEVSRFMFEDGQWFYVDGEAKKGTTVRSEKTGRNDPCPCGSGKKYKKCCGRNA